MNCLFEHLVENPQAIKEVFKKIENHSEDWSKATVVHQERILKENEIIVFSLEDQKTYFLFDGSSTICLSNFACEYEVKNFSFHLFYLFLRSSITGPVPTRIKRFDGNFLLQSLAWDKNGVHLDEIPF